MSPTEKKLILTEYGSTDLWSFHLVDIPRYIGCTSHKTFLRYLCSKSTLKARLEFGDYTKKQVRVVLVGPRCDDGDYLELEFVMQSDLIHDTPPWGFTSDEKLLLSSVLKEVFSYSAKREAHTVACKVLNLPRQF